MKSLKRGLRSFFEPKSVALIGATEKIKFGFPTTKCLIESNFRVYPVNPSEAKVMGVKAYKKVGDIPGKIDLAIIMIPAHEVPSVMRECAKKGVKSVIIESAGFSEIGKEGERLEKEVVKIARENGMRVLGPNCVGLLNVNNGFSTTGTKAQDAKRGGIAVIAQSGVLGNIILEWAPSHNVGFSKVITIGNQCDVSELELMEYLAEDGKTKVIAMYLEGIKDGRKFLEVAKRVTKVKPVLVIKSGRTEIGSLAVASHTGSLAGEDRIYDAAFKQAGVIRADEFEELFSFAKTFELQPLPKGNKIAIMTTSGSLGVLACDECVDHGLKLADFSPETKESIRVHTPNWVSVKNPLDVGPSMVYEPLIEAILADKNVDAFLLIIVAPLISFGQEEIFDIFFRSFRDLLSKYHEKTIVFCTFGHPDLTIKKAREHIEEKGVPVFTSPTSAVRAIASLYKYKVWLES